jgi:hypothetical protein
MKWLVATIGLLVAGKIEGCSTPCDSCKNDTGDTGCASLAVSGGESCTGQEGETTCGFAPICLNSNESTTSCVCNAGKWDCGKCPACVMPVMLGSECTPGYYDDVCSGPTTAKQCDGTSQAVTGNCECGGARSVDYGWVCDGVTTIVCDAGTDTKTD